MGADVNIRANTAADGTEVHSMQFACVRKVQYHDERKAWQAVFKMRGAGKDCGRLTPYQCPHCLHWHIGNLPARGIKL